MSEARRQADAARRRRLEMFIMAFSAELFLGDGKAPTPTALNMWMRRGKYNNLNGELTRWRTFLLREFGFKRVKGRWVR